MQLEKIKKQVSQYAIRHNIKNIEVGIYNKGHVEYISNSGMFQNAFQIGSISKVFTAFAIMIAINEGKISLRNTIQDFFPDIIMNEDIATISITELLTHTSGLPSIPAMFLDIMKDNESNPYESLKPQDIILYFESKQPINQKEYHYSNFGFGLLSIIIEIVYKIPFDNFMKSKIFMPLEMNSTSVNPTHLNNNILLEGYTKNDNKTPVWTDKTLSGAGAIISTTNDFIKFIEAHFVNNQFTKPLTEIQAVQNKKMCYGWHRPSFISRIAGLRNYVWHNGMVGGYSSFTAISQKKMTGIIILANKAISLDELGILLPSSF